MGADEHHLYDHGLEPLRPGHPHHPAARGGAIIDQHSEPVCAGCGGHSFTIAQVILAYRAARYLGSGPFFFERDDFPTSALERGPCDDCIAAIYGRACDNLERPATAADDRATDDAAADYGATDYGATDYERSDAAADDPPC